MNEERDVATATRPSIATDYTQPPVTPLARIETPLPPARVEFSAERIELLKNTIAKGASDDELQLFMYQCKRTGLDPFTRQCYFMKRSSWDKRQRKTVETFQFEVSIDGLRLIAERTGKYAGQVAPQWADVYERDGKVVIDWYEIWPFGAEKMPYAARVGVLRKDFDAPLFAVARFDAYKQTVDVWENDQKTDKTRLNAMWAKRGAEQLAKCAEALALRQAFPNEMSGVYTTDEMDQSESVDDDEGRREVQRQQPPVNRKGTKQERSQAADRRVRSEPLAIYAGRTVSRYPVVFPFGKEPVKGAALDQNPLTNDKKSAIEREYVITGELLARAFDWADKALSGKQTIDEVVDGQKTGKKVPVVLDAAQKDRFEKLRSACMQEIERREIEREEHRAKIEKQLDGIDGAKQPLVPDLAARAGDSVGMADGTEPDDVNAEDRGEAYEGD